MKKSLLILSLLAFFNIPATYAATGAAYDGMLFLLSVGGLMLIVAAIFWSVDYLRRNGRKLFAAVSNRIIRLFSPRRRKDAKIAGKEEQLSALAI
jgi:uncharacterized protein involved in response to NO